MEEKELTRGFEDLVVRERTKKRGVNRNIDKKSKIKATLRGGSFGIRPMVLCHCKKKMVDGGGISLNLIRSP
jgi:hypothetical protein